MALTHAERCVLIERWTLKSSASEQDRMERAERMVREAIYAHWPLLADRRKFKIYAKGSYANQTNVRQDSDVDIVVENHDVYHLEYFSNEMAQAATPDPSFVPYEGPWKSTNWRTEVETALKNFFGTGDVDTSGNVAITVKEVAGSRPSADVVPAFDFVRYDSPDRAPSSTHKGSKVFKKDGTGHIINYPEQQRVNGSAKDRATYGKYKEFARALKNGENALVKAGLMKEKPSYLMECLAYNVANGHLTRGSNRSDWFQDALAQLHNTLLATAFVYEDWLEPNELKYLFGSDQKWKVDDARELTMKLWDYLEYP